MIRNYKIPTAAILSFALSSCTYFLDAVPDRSLVVPSTIEEYSQLLNRTSLYTTIPSVTDFGLHELNVPFTLWNGSNTRFRSAYVWDPDPYSGNSSSGPNSDWINPYHVIYYANVVLDGLPALKNTDQVAYNKVKGQALFLRSFHHLMLQEVFGQPYRPASAENDLGIPLRLDADLESPIKRATVRETFDQIKRDALDALSLLPADYQLENHYAASKAAAAALLARVHLIQQDYPLASSFADAALGYYDRLLDFNELSPDFRFSNTYRPEVIFYCQETGAAGMFTNRAVTAHPDFIGLYHENDLRLKTFFNWNEEAQGYNFHSFYSGESSPFAGLATDEVYLIRAECRARLGDEQGALDDLNELLAHRYETDTFVPLTRTGVQDVLGTVLRERRKELILRNIRWSDLRRLNQDPRFAVTLRRELNGQIYELPPTDNRYALLIPPKEVQLSNLTQNER